MSEEWITTKEASERLKTSSRYVVELIHKKKLKARRDGNRWLVHSSLSPEAEESSGTTEESYRNLQEMVEYLKEQIKQKDKQIDSLQKQLDSTSEASQQYNMIIMQLTKNLGDSQKALEIRNMSWWKRLRLKKGKEEDKIE